MLHYYIIRAVIQSQNNFFAMNFFADCLKKKTCTDYILLLCCCHSSLFMTNFLSIFLVLFLNKQQKSLEWWYKIIITSRSSITPTHQNSLNQNCMKEKSNNIFKLIKKCICSGVNGYILPVWTLSSAIHNFVWVKIENLIHSCMWWL